MRILQADVVCDLASTGKLCAAIDFGGAVLAQKQFPFVFLPIRRA